jgi:DNA invertase Pin-like site-specific DNA recombinase
MKYVIYRRISIGSQENGYGLEAQKYIADEYLKFRKDAEVIGDFNEVASGAKNNRPQLKLALELCGKTHATLLIAKLDRLSRNATFLLTLRDSGVDFVCCDHPNADRFTIGVLALVAEQEREMISQRTRDALAAAKRRGVKLGNPRWQDAIGKMNAGRSEKAVEFRARVLPVIAELRAANVTTLGQIAHCLNVRGLKTFTGKPFLPQTVQALG